MGTAERDRDAPETGRGRTAGIEALLSAGESRIADSAADRLTLELCKDHQQALHRLPERRGGLEALGMGAEFDAVYLKDAQQLCKIGKIAADAVELIDQYRPDLIPADSL